MRNKHNSASISPKECEVKPRLDNNNVEHLLHTIKQLKGRIQYFENYFESEVAQTNSNLYKSNNGNIQVGDFKKDNIKFDCKRNEQILNKKSAINIESPDESLYKCSRYFKTHSDRHRSIYTTNECTVNPLILQKTLPNQSEQYKYENELSTVSLAKSFNSLHKDTYVKINPLLNSKQFKIAAEEFILQTEELKSKIICILDNSIFDNVSCSSFPESDCGLDDSFDKNKVNSENVLENVNSQYTQILESLVSIKEQIKNTNNIKQKRYTKLSKTSPKVSAYKPKHLPNSNTSSLKNLKINSPQKYKKTKVKRNSKILKKLEPVVLVYEPIKPSSDITKEICSYCGYNSNSCLNEYKDNLSV